MKILTTAWLILFAAASLASQAAPNRTSVSKTRPAKCQTRWISQASISPLLNALEDPSLVECGKPKSEAPVPQENRPRLSENFRGVGPRN